MALIKMKPTSPGTRFVVKIDRSHLHKGGPLEALTTKKNRTGARNHSGRQTTRHIGGGHKQRYRIVDFKRDKDGITTFIPHEIDDDSGIGTQFAVQDMNGDGLLDIIISNKKGVFLFLQVRDEGKK